MPPKKPELSLTVRRILRNGLDIEIAVPRSQPRPPPYASSLALPRTLYPQCITTRPVSTAGQRAVFSYLQVSDDEKSARLVVRETPPEGRAPAPTNNVGRTSAKKRKKKAAR
jgi:hypothetical protein